MKKKSNTLCPDIRSLRFVFLIMRLTLFFMMCFIVTVQANSYSQSTKLSMSLRNVSVEDVFNEIEQNTEFIFFYQDQSVDLNRKVRIKANNDRIEEVLEQLFEGTNNKWAIEDRQILIYEELSEIAPILAKLKMQQPVKKELKGTIVDENNIPLAGVSVFVEGTAIGTITNADGQYTLNVFEDTKTITVSFIGMETKTVNIGNSTILNVTMQQSEIELEEMVVTALGIKREAKSLGYTASKVSGVEVALSSTPNVVNALSGKAPGVFITNPSSVEGGSTRVTIRGNTSLSGGNQPLIIVDGMPYANELTATSPTANRDYGSALNQIEALDIQSMDILKGTAASALYGSRGANGVILITTKKGAGRSGMKVEYTINTKVTTPYRYQEFQNEYGYGGPGGPNGALWKKPVLGDKHPDIWGDGYGIIPAVLPNGNNYSSWSYDFFSWYGTNSSWGPKFNDKTITWWDGEQRKWSAQPDNMRLFYQNGSTTTHNLSLSNSGSFGNFRTSITQKSNKAIVDRANFNTTNIYIGGNLNLSKKLTAEVFATYNRKEQNNPPLLGQTNDSFTNLFYNLPRSYRALEWTDYKNDDGSRNNFNGWGYWTSKNLGWDFHENDYKNTTNQMRSYVHLRFAATDWLTVSGSAGLDFTSVENENKYGWTDGIGLSPGHYTHNLARTYAPNLKFLTTLYKDDLVEGLNGSISFGGESWETSRYYIQGNVNRTAKSPYIYSFANTETDPTAAQARPSEQRYEKKINSLYGLMDLSYKDFIYLQVTARNDWSSTLPIENSDYFIPAHH